MAVPYRHGCAILHCCVVSATQTCKEKADNCQLGMKRIANIFAMTPARNRKLSFILLVLDEEMLEDENWRGCTDEESEKENHAGAHRT